MAVTKKLRFEVFKRDSFTCQYCGSKAPDVVLEVDHIKPKSKGGDDNILNLVTSCFDCNRGKSARELHENEVLNKQRDQLEEINEKRLQLEMMLEWRDELSKLDDMKIDSIKSLWYKITSIPLDSDKEVVLRRWVKRYDLINLMESMEVSVSQYLKKDKQGNIVKTTIDKSFDYTEKIYRNKERYEQKPHLKELHYAKGILQNRINFVDKWKVMKYLTDAYEAGASTDELKELCKSVKNWTEFKNSIEAFLSGEELLASVGGDVIC